MNESIIFFGTPTIAATVLESLHQAAGQQQLPKITAVITEPDKPAGRGQQLKESSVKQTATKLGIPVYSPADQTELLTTCQQLRQTQKPVLGVIVAYGRLIPIEIINLFPKGIVNLHGSLLPKYRGAAPAQQAILDGLTETGVSLQLIDAGLDTGPLLAQQTIIIDPNETTATLLNKMAVVGAKLLQESIPNYLNGTITPKPQTGTPTYAPKMTKNDGLINWQQSDLEIERQIRACQPWPGTYTQFRGKRLLIKTAHLDQGQLIIDQVQPEGKPVMSWAAWLNGLHLTTETALAEIKQNTLDQVNPS